MKKSILLIIYFLSNILLFSTNIANYDMDVSIYSDTLRGYEKIQYINNTNDTIKDIHLFLYPNYFADTSSFYNDKIKWNKTKQGYLIIDSCFVNGIRADYKVEKYNAIIKLDSFLIPYDTLILLIYFEHKIPYPYLREGYKNGMYDLMQWYPQINVYKNGKWEDIYPDTKAEFFTEYGNYKLSLNIPGEYYVFGTGKVVVPEYELKNMQSIADTGKYDYRKANTKDRKTVVLEANNVNELAIILRREFAYIRDTLQDIDIEIVCKEANANIYKEQIDIIRKAINYFSNKYYDYPYDKITIADGLLRAGGGMEYPSFIMIGDFNKGFSDKIKFIDIKVLEQLIVHELAHQWFYQIIGSNQAFEPFMDESFAVYSEMDFMEKHFEHYFSIFNKNILSIFDMYYIIYLFAQNNKMAKPIDYSAYSFENGFEYNVSIYAKGGLIVRMVESLLGEKEFNNILKGFFKKYAFKHPSIDELETYINEYTDYKYSIELKYLLHENFYTDFYIKSVNKENENYIILIDNKSPFRIQVPVFLQFNNSDTLIYTYDSIIVNEYPENIIIDKNKRYLDIDYYDNIQKKYWKFNLFGYDYFANNVYVYPFISHSIIERVSPGILLRICDIPSFELNNMAIYGNYDFNMFMGHSPVLGFLYKHSFVNYQGDNDKTKFRHTFEYNNYYFEIKNSIAAFKKYGSKNTYIFSIGNYFRYHINNSQYINNRLYEGQLSVLIINFYYSNQFHKLNYFINPVFEFSDPVIYSSIDYKRVICETGINYISNNLQLSLKYGFNSLYGEENVENIFYLNNNPNKLFYDKTMNINNYSINIKWDNTFNYFNPDKNSFNTLQYASFVFGNKIIGAYINMYIGSEHFNTYSYYYQTGIKLSFGRVLVIDIPIYNDKNGNIILKSFNITISSHIIK